MWVRSPPPRLGWTFSHETYRSHKTRYYRYRNLGTSHLWARTRPAGMPKWPAPVSDTHVQGVSRQNTCFMAAITTALIFSWEPALWTLMPVARVRMMRMSQKKFWMSDKSWEPGMYECLIVLNNFCFHVEAQKSLFIAENCNGFFFDLTTTLSTDIRVHRAGSQLKM